MGLHVRENFTSDILVKARIEVLEPQGPMPALATMMSRIPTAASACCIAAFTCKNSGSHFDSLIIDTVAPEKSSACSKLVTSALKPTHFKPP